MHKTNKFEIIVKLVNFKLKFSSKAMFIERLGDVRGNGGKHVGNRW